MITSTGSSSNDTSNIEIPLEDFPLTDLKTILSNFNVALIPEV